MKHSLADRVNFFIFWTTVVLEEDHPMRPLVKVLIENNETIDDHTATLLYLAHEHKPKLEG